MKRFLCILFAIWMILLCSACGTSASEDDPVTATTEQAVDVDAAQYVGQWKANTVAGLVDGEKTYRVSVIELNSDGSGAYKGKALTWAYSEEYGTINVTLLKENQNTSFEIDQVDGKTVLRFFEDVYYRAADFDAMNDIQE